MTVSSRDRITLQVVVTHQEQRIENVSVYKYLIVSEYDSLLQGPYHPAAKGTDSTVSVMVSEEQCR
jgi:hypothetical protein